MQSTSITLRTLQWPELSRVDLTREFHWTVHDDGDDNPSNGGGDDEQDEPTTSDDAEDLENSLLVNEQVDSGDLYQKHYAPLSDLAHSPYRQQLQQQKEKRPPLSPAQRAAKKILKLKLELGYLEDDDAFTSNERCDYPEQLQQFVGRGDHFGDSLRQFQEIRQQKNTKQPISTTQPTTRRQIPRVPPGSKASPPSTSPTMKKELRIAKPQVQTREEAGMGMTSRGPATSSSSSRPLSSQSTIASKKKKKRPETKDQRELRELHKKQKRLADWLALDTRSSKEKDVSGDDHVTYSVEVESRIHHAMEATRDKGLWGDPVASLIASEMTSESVFGGFIPKRRLAFPPTTPELESTSGPVLPLESPDLVNSEEDTIARIEIPVHEGTSSLLIHERALEIRQEAQQLVQVGNIEDALATLQDGIKQLLFDFQDNQDEIQTAGFNFSQDAHAKATAVQLKYKARHRKRVQKIAFLQKVWHDYQVRKGFLDTKRFKSVNARVIQRQYKQRFFRNQRIKAATRIQNCFRIFQEQKVWVCLHRACRVLVNDERKKRERIRKYQTMKKRLWGKLTTVLRMLWLWKSRAIAPEPGVGVRKPRLDQAMVLYHQFLTRTRVGNQLVRWQMDKPWLRFKRLRRQEENASCWLGLGLRTRVKALYGMLLKHHLGARQLRAFGHLLGVESSQVAKIRHQLEDASVESLVTLYESVPPTSKPVAGLADGATPVLSSQSKPVRVTKWLNKREAKWTNWVESWKLRMSRQLLLLYWRLVFWPLSYLVDRNSSQNRQRAMNLLEQQQRFALTKYLRLVYRRLDPTAKGSRPNFACAYCSKPFATANACNVHLRICKQWYNEQLLEWEAIQQDIVFFAAQQNNPSSSSASLQLSKTATPQEYLDFSTFQLGSDFVKQLLPERSEKWRRFCGNITRRALRMLVEMAVCCGVDSPRGGTLQGLQTALELVAFLLLSLPRASSELLHPLAVPQLHAFVAWKPVAPQDPSLKSEALATTTANQSQWISEKELFAKLLLSTQPMRSSWSVGRFVRIATRAVGCWWQRAKTWVRSVSSSSSSRYHQHPQTTSSASATVLPVA